MSEEQVTPEYESVPERSYIRTEATITCYPIIADDGGVTERQLVLGDSPVFTLELPSEELAVLLMNDLYYGEYTGG